jgi:hypothetical protein
MGWILVGQILEIEGLKYGDFASSHDGASYVCLPSLYRPVMAITMQTWKADKGTAFTNLCGAAQERREQVPPSYNIVNRIHLEKDE